MLFRCVAASVTCIALVAACGGSTSAGGGGSSGTLDCSWLASNNCWKTTLAAAASCLPASTDTGKISADKNSCTYANTTITFDEPLVSPIPNGKRWSFTVATNGAQCLKFATPATGSFSLTTSAGTASEQAVGTGVTISCPDGSSYATTNALGLLSCDGGFFGGLPGTDYTNANGTITLSLLGGPMAETHVFTCAP